MLFLIISVMASVSVSVLLKLARKKNLPIEQMVMANYMMASVWAWLFLKPDVHIEQLLPHTWVLVLLGVLLPSVFIVMGQAVTRAGIVKSDVAQRLSLILSIIAAFVLFQDVLTINKIIGLILAFSALACLFWKRNHLHKQVSWSGEMALIGVWIGYGVIDILFKYLTKLKLPMPNLLLVVFVLSGILAFLYLLIRGTVWSKRALLVGLFLGGLNFLNIFTYMQAHIAFKTQPTIVFAGMNMGVIALGTVIGVWIFGEHINKINVLGIILALLAMIGLFLFK